MSDCAQLLSFEPVADGSVEFRIRAEYRISDKTTLSQDIVFYAASPRVDFETTIDWNDKHRLLKTVFDTTIRAEYSLHEIQFGNVSARPTAILRFNKRALKSQTINIQIFPSRHTELQY